MTNAMQKIRIEKVTLNVGAGKDPVKLEKGIKLLKDITGIDPVKTITNKRLPAWNLRPGLPIGCKITLRGAKADEVLRNVLAGKNNTLKAKQFDKGGNLAFGIHEYIDIPSLKYNPEIGIMGFELCVTFEKPGYRLKKRKIRPAKIGIAQHATKEEAIAFMTEIFGVKVE
ncbi:50S ribosomal protein L5 [Candidatus Woesearchaeota archaeon]|nr:50S ribosomal protein L5 [Candidatus Woesearchaeota archaeon]